MVTLLDMVYSPVSCEKFKFSIKLSMCNFLCSDIETTTFKCVIVIPIITKKFPKLLATNLTIKTSLDSKFYSE